MDTITIPFTSDMFLGQPVSAISGATFCAASPLKGAIDENRSINGISFEFDGFISESEDFLQKSETEFNLAGKGWGWSISAFFGHLATKVGQRSSLVAYEFRGSMPRNIGVKPSDVSTLELNNDAQELLRKEGPIAFVNKYGTHFITEFCVGSIFLSVFKLTFASHQEREIFKKNGAISYSSIFLKANLSASASNESANKDSKYSLESSRFSMGGATSKYDLINATNTKDSATNILAICRPWDQLESVCAILRERTESWPKPDPECLKQLAEFVCRLQYLRGTAEGLTGVIRHPDKEALKMLKDAIQNRITATSRLKFEEILSLGKSENKDALSRFVDTENYNSDLNKLVKGKTKIKCILRMHPGWNLTEDQPQAYTKNKDGSFSCTLSVSPSTKEIVVFKAHCPKANATGYCKFKYAAMNDSGGADETATRKLQALTECACWIPKKMEGKCVSGLTDEDLTSTTQIPITDAPPQLTGLDLWVSFEAS